MRLRSILLSGWRSFAPTQPLLLDGLSRVNLIIGPNNVGKSNVGLFLAWLGKYRMTPTETQSYSLYSLYELMTIEAIPFKQVDRMDVHVRPQDAWDRDDIDDGWIHAHFELEDMDYINCVDIVCDTNGVARADLFIVPNQRPLVKTDSSETTHILTFEVKTPEGQKILNRTLLTNNRGESIYECWDPERNAMVLADQHPKTLNLTVEIFRYLTNSIIHIPSIRHQRGGADTMGRMIIDRMHAMQSNEQTRNLYVKVRHRVEHWISRLFGMKIRIDIAPSSVQSNAPAVHFVFEGDRAHSHNLLDLGDGVAQAFYLLAHLAVCGADRPFVVFIDEIETSIHPAAALELVRIIESNFPHVQLFITSHSTTLIDGVRADWRVFRMNHDDEGTVVYPVENRADQLAVLDVLGIRASQLFLANVLVWVEGPSDIIYLDALLRQCDPDLVRGRDFTFVTYGGASGAALTFLDDTEGLIRILQIANGSIVIRDRDGSVETGTPPAMVERLVREIEVLNIPNNSVVTVPGREIENLVIPEIFQQAISDVGQKFIMTDCGRVPIEYKIAQMGMADSFDKVYSEAAVRSDGGELSKSQRARIAENFAGKKVSIARWVAEKKVSIFTDSALEFGAVIAEAIRRVSVPKPPT